MSAEPDVGNDDEEHEAESQASSMQDQLSKEVASWSKERRQQSSETVIVTQPPPVVQRRSPRLTGESKKASAPPVAGKANRAGSKPFSMSYDGVTAAQYARSLLERRSR